MLSLLHHPGKDMLWHCFALTRAKWDDPPSFNCQEADRSAALNACCRLAVKSWPAFSSKIFSHFYFVVVVGTQRE